MIPGQKLYRAAFALGVLAIVVLSLMAQDSLPSVKVSDKLNHVLAYGCVMLVGGLGFRSTRQRVWLVLGMSLLGTAMELLQGPDAEPLHVARGYLRQYPGNRHRLARRHSIGALFGATFAGFRLTVGAQSCRFGLVWRGVKLARRRLPPMMRIALSSAVKKRV